MKVLSSDTLHLPVTSATDGNAMRSVGSGDYFVEELIRVLKRSTWWRGARNILLDLESEAPNAPPCERMVRVAVAGSPKIGKTRLCCELLERTWEGKETPQLDVRVYFDSSIPSNTAASGFEDSVSIDPTNVGLSGLVLFDCPAFNVDDSEGVELARRAARAADLVIVMVDHEQVFQGDVGRWLADLPDKSFLFLLLCPNRDVKAEVERAAASQLSGVRRHAEYLLFSWSERDVRALRERIARFISMDEVGTAIRLHAALRWKLQWCNRLQVDLAGASTAVAAYEAEVDRVVATPFRASVAAALDPVRRDLERIGEDRALQLISTAIGGPFATYIALTRFLDDRIAVPSLLTGRIIGGRAGVAVAAAGAVVSGVTKWWQNHRDGNIPSMIAAALCEDKALRSRLGGQVGVELRDCAERAGISLEPDDLDIQLDPEEMAQVVAMSIDRATSNVARTVSGRFSSAAPVVFNLVPVGVFCWILVSVGIALFQRVPLGGWFYLDALVFVMCFLFGQALLLRGLVRRRCREFSKSVEEVLGSAVEVPTAKLLRKVHNLREVQRWSTRSQQDIARQSEIARGALRNAGISTTPLEPVTTTLVGARHAFELTATVSTKH